MNKKPLTNAPKIQNADTAPFSSHVSDENHIEVTRPEYTATANAEAATGNRSETIAYPPKSMGNTSIRDTARAMQDHNAADLRILANA
jgi:hypothetical protein